MWKPLIRCAIIGGIVVFLWQMVAWMVLPMHKMQMNRFESPSQALNCILDNAPKDGVYVYPGMDMNVQGKSPMLLVNVARNVDFKNMTQSMVSGLIIQIIGAFLITWLLLRGKAMKYWDRVWFVTVAGGLVVGVLGALPAWNWWHFPGAWVVLELFDLVVGWFLGGLVIAKLAKK